MGVGGQGARRSKQEAGVQNRSYWLITRLKSAKFPSSCLRLTCVEACDSFVGCLE